MTEAVASKKLVPGEYTAFRWNLRDFKYGDLGVEQPAADGEDIRVKDWHKAWDVLEPEVKALEIFKRVFSALQEAYPSLPVNEWLDSLMKELIWGMLLEDSSEQGSPEEIRARFFDDLQGGPVRHTAQIFLVGVALRSDAIEVGTGVRIRKPRKEEFERPQLPYLVGHFPRFPSAIVEIETTGPRDRPPQQLQIDVHRCIALFRLFRVGSVKYWHYDMRTSSVVTRWPRGRAGSGDETPALETYVIAPEDEPLLQRFWQTVTPKLPTDIYHFRGRASHTTLAYDRYSDGVLQNGIIERRIANAIMGLEALFLREKDELSYRLGLRVGKLISIVCNYNPLEVAESLKDAYEIRSAFAHGDQLSKRTGKKIERKYSSTKKLLLTVLDYLRVALVATVMSGVNKVDLISLIDNALLDPRENDRLRSDMSGAIQVFSYPEITFGYPEEWRALVERHPEFLPRFPNIAKAIDVAFKRTFHATGLLDHEVYFLGRLVAEEYMEILLLCANGYGIGAQKLLRGMYERAVTACYLRAHPEEVENYLSFHKVAAHKFLKAVEASMGNEVFSPEQATKIEEEFNEVKGRFLVTDCKVCNTTRLNHTWSSRDLVSMARTSDDLWRLLIPAYYKPTREAHSTMGAIFSRLDPEAASRGEGFVFDGSAQHAPADEALMVAHHILLIVLGLQKEHFRLEALEPMLQSCFEDFLVVWKN